MLHLYYLSAIILQMPGGYAGSCGTPYLKFIVPSYSCVVCYKNRGKVKGTPQLL
jgi:hypothetical protein